MKKQVILITGASSGMGKEMAKVLLKEGHTVYGAARHLEKMSDLKKLGAKLIKMDVTKSNEIQKGVQTLLKEEQQLDVLINNAGFGLFGAVEDIPMEDVRYQFEVNLFGVGELTKAVLPQMRKQHSGKIINISSMGGKVYTPLGAWYHATKHAIEGWSDCLRLELASFNINVIVIEPGVIDTGFGDVLAQPLLKYSGAGAYEKLTHRVGKTMAQAYGKNTGSPPSVVAKCVAKVVQSKHPSTRYAVGKLAKLSIWVRKLLGDRLYDWILMSRY